MPRNRISGVKKIHIQSAEKAGLQTRLGRVNELENRNSTFLVHFLAAALTAQRGDNQPVGALLFCLPEGRVVGILQKNWRDYVVTFPSKEEVQSQGKNAQKILVTPWDYRIPKIRISTQQAEALQVAAPALLFCLCLRWLLSSTGKRCYLL